jgi:hypothetical protein
MRQPPTSPVIERSAEDRLLDLEAAAAQMEEHKGDN